MNFVLRNNPNSLFNKSIFIVNPLQPIVRNLVRNMYFQNCYQVLYIIKHHHIRLIIPYLRICKNMRIEKYFRLKII